MFVYCMMMLGTGFTGVEKVVAYLGLRHFSMATFLRYARYITKTAVDHASGIMDKCRKVIRERKEEIEIDTTDVAVSFDGSWHQGDIEVILESVL